MNIYAIKAGHVTQGARQSIKSTADAGHLFSPDTMCVQVN